MQLKLINQSQEGLGRENWGHFWGDRKARLEESQKQVLGILTSEKQHDIVERAWAVNLDLILGLLKWG